MVLGIWKNYEELEDSLSMPELVEILAANREKEYNYQKFLAALKGIDLDKESGQSNKAWDDLKAKVFTGGAANDSNDIVSLQGINAQQAGFGIGMGLEYSDLKGEEPKNPFG